MAKTVKSDRSSGTGKFVTKAIGKRKASKFSSVEGMELTEESRTISRNAVAGGLSGDSYRAEVAKALKKR